MSLQLLRVAASSLILALCVSIGESRAQTPWPSRTGSGAFDERATPTVPDVVGMERYEAEDAVLKARLRPDIKYLDAPDNAVPMGHIRATVPPVGVRLAPGSTVQLQIPRAAILVGIGQLSAHDLERRNGFDLDTGTYSEITHGADIVVNDHYFEASDGAELSDPDFTGNDVNASALSNLGSYFFYKNCELHFKDYKKTSVSFNINLGSNGNIFCVKTSKSQMAVVQILSEDNNFKSSDGLGYKFHFALFPNPRPAMALGRVKPAPGAPPPPPRTLCEAARDARARNSPAAPGLERQCRAQGGQ